MIKTPSQVEVLLSKAVLTFTVVKVNFYCSRSNIYMVLVLPCKHLPLCLVTVS